MNGLTQKENPLKLDKGSPISELSLSNLPSPKTVVENNIMKNAQLLPNYDGADELTLTKQQQYFLKVAKQTGQLLKDTGSRSQAFLGQGQKE